MKILHVIDSGGMYGAEVMLLNLVEEQIQQGMQPVIASIGALLIKEKALEKEARERNIPLKVFRMRPGLNVNGAKQLLKYCHDENFDIIHSHGYKCNILLGPLPGFIRKKPMLSTVHGWTSTTTFTKMRIYEWLDALSLRFVNGVVFVNKGMLQNLKITHLNKKKIFWVDNGIPLHGYDNENIYNEPMLNDIVDFCQNGIIVGSIGRYSFEKGYNYLISAISLLMKKGINVKLLLIGSGPLSADYERQIDKLGLGDRILMTGYISNASRFMELMSVYVISSLTEGLPITLLEAMRAKLPIVATSVGGIPEVLAEGSAGVLIPKQSATAIANSIEKVIKDDFGERFKQLSFERLKNFYSSCMMAEKYNCIYRKLIAEW